MGELADAIYDLVKGLLERGVPIHGVGLQMHISLESSEWFESAVSNCC
ncbi:MAG: endo-1,4-beta-xylanase [Candidatus Thorarchaeota archaeon]